MLDYIERFIAVAGAFSGRRRSRKSCRHCERNCRLLVESSAHVTGSDGDPRLPCTACGGAYRLCIGSCADSMCVSCAAYRGQSRWSHTQAIVNFNVRRAQSFWPFEYRRISRAVGSINIIRQRCGARFRASVLDTAEEGTSS